MSRMAATRFSLAAARHGEIGVERNLSSFPAIAGGNRTDHDGGVEHMVVEREIVGRYARDAAIALVDPVRCPKGPCRFEQFSGRGLSGPVGFKCEFQFPMPADT